MKIIGMADDGYVAIVSHTEIEKVVDKYYGNLKQLKAGDRIDLGEGYDFRREIKSACEHMVEASRKFKSAQDTLMKFASMVVAMPDSSEEA